MRDHVAGAGADVGARRPRVLIAGGGVAALETLLALRELAAERLELCVLAPAREFVYRPLSVLEPFATDASGGTPTPSLPLADVVAEQGATLLSGALAAVDVDAGMAVTRAGERIFYGDLVVAVGARPERAVAGALTFGAPQDAGAIAEVVRGVRAGTLRRVAFAVPDGVAWTLPLYELALRLGTERDPQGRAPELLLVTPEQAPLEAFGPEVSATARELLGEHGVALRTASMVEIYEDGLLWIELEGAAEVDALIALPRLRGPAIAGLPADADGFVPVDGFGRVAGEEGVHAAGDATAQPLKQGGLAAQLADVVAQDVVHRLLGGPRPSPFDPVLRTVLLTGGPSRFLRAHVARNGEEHEDEQVADEPLWWPPAKIHAQRLAPYLAERLLREPA
ncbi:MAG: FAD-dependent oxidoreductase [Actinobacteria bacterium]|nr:FAD-dependent oxidoreductase [Actinomycetota bacterium]